MVKKIDKLSNGKIVIGLNTGCGLRWKTRLWPKEYWIRLINMLHKKNYFCLLMGGPDEDEMNRYYNSETGATYLGVFGLEEFISISNNTDIIVTPVKYDDAYSFSFKKTIDAFS